MIRILFLAMAAFLLQDDTPEPDKPVSCDNYLQTPAEMRCHCARDRQECHGLPEPRANVELDHSCKTYCRMQHCNCAGHGCRS